MYKRQDLKRAEANAAASREEFNSLIREVFGQGRGMEVLHHLRNGTIEVPLIDASRAIAAAGSVALTGAEWAYFREGQNSIVRYLEQMVSDAQNLEGST